jgi:arginase
MRNIEFIEIMSEIGAGTRGASLGLNALKVADQNKKGSFFKNMNSQKVKVHNEFLYKEIDTPKALRIEGIHAVYKNHASIIQETIKANQFPFIFAGDHSTAGATIAGLKMAQPEKKLGVIWVDAHADLHSPYTSPSGNVHGMPLACCLNHDNFDAKINEPVEKTKKHWNDMKNLGDICPKILPEDIVFIALRDFEKPEEHIIDKNNIKVITVEAVRQNGTSKAVSSSIEYLASCDHIYVSFDVDSLDSAISKGTGTPVADGLTAIEANEILLGLLKNKKVNCFEVTEINPTLDSENKMAETVLPILENCFATLASN